MMINTVSKIVRNGQITIPSRIRKNLHLQDGDLMRFDVKHHQLVITPVSIVDKDQRYYFSQKWQKAIRKSEQEIKKGKFKTYRSVEELKTDLIND